MTVQETKTIPKTFTDAQWRKATQLCRAVSFPNLCKKQSDKVTNINSNLKCLWNPKRNVRGKKNVPAQKIRIWLKERGWHLITIPSEWVTPKTKLVQKKLAPHCEPWNKRGTTFR